MGMIRKRGRIWWVKYYKDGTPHEESSGSVREGDARRLLKLREGDIERGLPITPKVGRIRWEEARDDVVTDYKTNGKRSLPDLLTRLRLHLDPFFRGRRLATVTTADVRRYIDLRQTEKASAGTINRELTHLKRAFSLARQAGKMLHAPYVPMLRENNVRKGFFEREQLDALLSHLPAYAQPLVRFAYLTGWRASEVYGLQWRNVDLEGRQVLLDPGATKNGEGRSFPLTTELRRLLESQRQEADQIARENGRIVPWVFFFRNGDPVKSIRHSWVSACKRAGCPGRLFHDLRRTAVRNFVRANVPERVAMKLSGHKTRSVFDRYNIVSEGDLRHAAKQLEGASVTATVTNTRHA